MKDKLITVKDLIKYLTTLKEDAIVFIASDSEQNTVSPFYDVSIGTIGKPIIYNGQDYGIKEGDDFECFDYNENIDKPYVVLNPML